jgi:hypothetical protein
MSRGPQKIRQRDIAKVVKATVAAGIKVHSVEVEVPPDGDGNVRIVVVGKDGGDPASLNEWDVK